MRRNTFQDYTARMLRVLVHIQQHLDDELALDEVARVAHFSPYHFHRIFRGMVGEGLKEHIRRLRLERAAVRLKNSAPSVTDIAFEAGYETHEAFTRAFKMMFGVPPSRFKERILAVAPSGVHYDPEKCHIQFTPFNSGDIEAMEKKVTVVNRAPTRVAFMRHVGPYMECGEVWGKFLGVMGAAGRLGPDSVLMGLSHDDPEVTPPEKIRYDACTPVEDSYKASGEVGVQEVPGGDYAMIVHKGPYEKLHETYLELVGRWVPHSGRELRPTPCVEIYLKDPHKTPPEELLTEIYAPLESQ